MLSQLNDVDFNASAAKKLIVMFTSPWCSGCKKVEPFMEAFSSAYPEIMFSKLDIISNPLTPSNLGIMSLPTIVAFSAGAEFERITGEPTKHELERLIKDMA
jgi:thiol-disulfide isomerase/thioredoxin